MTYRECEADDCKSDPGRRMVYARDRCRACYTRARRHGVQLDGGKSFSDDERVCTNPDCRSAEDRRKYYARGMCLACWARARKRSRGIPEKGSRAHWTGADKSRWDKYRITPEEFDALLQRQGGRCAVPGCQRDPRHVDHCHGSGRVRGVLCHVHNVVLLKEITREDLLFLADYV